VKKKVTEKTPNGYPNVASVIALVGGIIIMLGGMLLVTVSAFVLPYIDYSKVTPPPDLAANALPHLVSGMVGVMGIVGLFAGIIVIASAVMLRLRPNQRETWGILVLFFSVLSFLGTGGFVVGAVTGIIAGIMILRWKQQTR
jgi:hypothetical protein